jgi:VWFA-related protein
VIEKQRRPFRVLRFHLMPLAMAMAGLVVLSGFAEAPLGQRGGGQGTQSQPQSQPTDQKSSAPPSVRVTTRLVQVSVVVHDSDGKPVTGLTKDDFVLFDEGHRQKITSFAEQTNRLTATKAALPADLFSNRSAQGAQPPLIVIVLDVYNGRYWDQTFCPPPGGLPPICVVDPMFKAVEEFISGMRPQDRVALYELGTDQLYLLQDFTSDPTELQHALDSGKEHIPSRFSPSQSDPITMSNQTMAAMHEIANRLAKVPGRKNLIWLSNGFPRQRIITEATTDKTAKTLGNADLPLSAVDARGLAAPFGGGGGPVPRGGGGGAAGRGGTASGGDGPTPAGGNFGARGGPVGGFNALRNLAEASGGRAIYGTNDLAGAIRRVIDESSSTYLLGYYPGHNKWNAEDRKSVV